MSTGFEGLDRSAGQAVPEQGAPGRFATRGEAEQLTALSATDLVAGYEKRSLSPVEVTDAVLGLIERENPALNAFCLVRPDEAREAARASEERWRRGEPQGRLDGVPTSIKDIHLTRGWPTLRGSRTVDPDQDWPEDSPVVARLRESGAVFVGKTTTPELAWKGTTDSPLTGITRNPWDLSVTPGGSSGGSAAAVASGMGPLATGTDGGGSVRIPASFTGTFALKPTYGVVPHYPASAFGTLAHTGPMTRTVADAALMLDVIGVPDHRDWLASPAPATPFSAALENPVRGLRIAYSPTLGHLEVEPEVARVVDDAVTAFAELGAHVEQVDPQLGDCRRDFQILWYTGAAKATERLGEQQRTLLDPGLREIIEEGLAYSAQDYLTAMDTRMRMGRIMGRFHAAYDLLLTPTMPITAFEAGREVPPGSADRRWTSWAGFSYPFNMTQQPAASVPCGLTAAGLPVGLQVVGPRHADGLVLAACRAFEEARPWAHL
ncbi:aspartyl-tRNA(Asn)/glutamyl-tRNA(Gln) amidotransferase subunit A [Nocardiopsis mwathae]|uniref:Aspartyl-tRNA(Asn)/glutamyl-tRNA(Gln) amidotransferase subunit A n=1 Tax=Nocardiopsis mwathae TaxID=1472723 RepID=A0A7W9YNY9_9ACTN|nr:amidase [Nocardiopsis mwathae]MBB6174566.1 aspartyl-tRNA(Asn)/glutamyl-tRNA(Gln) amidotransferase subunit A [Nocardiopsis mwathae]